MNPRGLVVIVAGIWVIAQVLGGDALGRLGLTSSSDGGSPAGGGNGIPSTQLPGGFVPMSDTGLTSTRPKVAPAPKAVSV